MFFCFDCYAVTEAEAVKAALASAALVTASVLTPTLVLTSGMRRLLSLRQYGSTRPTRDQLLALTSRHRTLDMLSRIATALTLILGGLIVELGYLVEMPPA